jgi:hypothetical protein
MFLKRPFGKNPAVLFPPYIAFIAFILIALMLPIPGFAQQADITVTNPPAPTGDDPFLQAMDAAQTVLNDGLATMSEDTLRRAALMYEDIIENYSLDNRHFDAYFAAAYIYIEYLQTSSDYEHAQNLLTLLINNHPSNYAVVVDAMIQRAQLEYRCTRDFRAAQEDLSATLNNPALSEELGSRDIDAKVFLAKCRQKLGEYAMAKAIWDELAISNPELDTEGRSQWLTDSATWFVLNDAQVRLFFEQDVDRDTYTSCLAQLHQGLDQAQATWGMSQTAPVDVFLYASSDRLFDYTTRSRGFALPMDTEIHMSPSDMSQIGHLAGWVLSQELNSRPDETAFPFLRAGFLHYFLAPSSDLDRSAARAIYYYGGSIPDYEIFFPLSFDYTYSDEYEILSASFLHYLIEDKSVGIPDLMKFYRLLWSRPISRYEPPATAALMSVINQGQVQNWGEQEVTPDKVYALSSTILGVDLQAEFVSWQAYLASDIAAVQAELGAATPLAQDVQVDLSTPENALNTWWNAYKAGDFDALIRSSATDMAEVFADAKALYEQQGILDQVIMDSFVRPNRDASLTIVESGQFADDLWVFQVQIVRTSGTEDATIVVRKEGNDWKIDSN